MIRPAAIMLAATMLCSTPLLAEEAPAVLTVSGHATLEVPADQLRISLGVEGEAKTVDDAHSKAVSAMDDVIKAMKKLGLEEQTEFTIERYNVNPQWSPRPRNPDSGWRATIVGYRVDTQMQIKTGKLELAGKIISAGIDAGANDIGSVMFGLTDPRTSRKEVIRSATLNALSDANVMARNAGVKLESIQSLSLDGSNYQPRQFKAAAEYGRAGMMAMDSAAPAPIVSGDVTITATVQLTWRISGP
ncbi:MAG: SIMPL domain-containing protein [Planctomycetota bacterium]|nr:SIMPL domain-containing protein [Planctomycetota bacterium]